MYWNMQIWWQDAHSDTLFHCSKLSPYISLYMQFEERERENPLSFSYLFVWFYFKLGLFLSWSFLKVKLSPSNWHLPCTSIRIKLWAAAAADLQHPLKGVQSVDPEWVNMCFGRNWLNRSSGSWIFSGILWAQFLHLLASGKALKSFMVTPD